MLDSCSEATMITKSFAQRQKIATYRSFSKISGVTPGNTASNFAGSITLRSTNTDFKLQIKAAGFPKILYKINSKLLNAISSNIQDFSLSKENTDHDSSMFTRSKQGN